MKIAVVGSGIAGMASAWLLSKRHQVVLFESDPRLGGHTHTHQVREGDRVVPIDSGFIVHNTVHYPLLTGLFDELGVESQATTMSFSVHSDASGVQYNATNLDGLFCQRRNLVSPRFVGMVSDIVRFYRKAPRLLDAEGPGPSLGEYLEANRYGTAFRDEHLVPMASALWSSPPGRILDFPAQYLVRFMQNHQMLSLAGRPEWRVVRGGSRRYIDALQARWRVDVRLSSPVRNVLRDAEGVDLYCDSHSERFDQVVLACHADQSLALLADANPVEREVLKAFRYRGNDTVLHTDAGVLPGNRKAWAAWNAHVPREAGAACTVSYCMNLLQGIASDTTYVVSLNRSGDIDPATVLARMTYHHPEYTHESVASQSRKQEIQGRHRTWYAGAYWGWGFHEDGMRSAVEVAHGIDGSGP